MWYYYFMKKFMENVEQKANNHPVAIARGVSRSEAVARALDLVSADIMAKVSGRIIIKPNFLSSTMHLASTQADAVRPVLAFLRDNGVSGSDITIAEGGSRSTAQAFENFGYRELAGEFGVALVDINHGGFARSFDIVDANGAPNTVSYSDVIADADTVISVPVAKTHDAAAVTLSIKNMMGILKRVHRPRMHGIRVGDTASVLAERLWDSIEGHPLVFKSFSGVVFMAAKMARYFDIRSGSGMVRQVRAMAENLARMAAVLLPDIAIIDAFEAMEGEGPGAGTSVSMGLAAASVDPVACDAIMASMMGFDPQTVGYLWLAHERGLGNADLSDILCIGENPKEVKRVLVPHSNYPSQRQWRNDNTGEGI